MPAILGELEQLLMLTVLRLGDNAHSVAVRQDLKARTGRDVSPGAVYTTLERLEGRGLIGSKYGDPVAERGGRSKRYYRLRAEGRRALSQALGAVRRATAGIEDQLPGFERS